MLLAAALVGLVLMNSPLGGAYDALLHTHVPLGIGALAVNKSLLHWINDGLMAIFFFLVGLEIKRELVVGELSTAKQAALPVIAALGGMLVPALIYAGINWGDPVALRGWAIPAATDIAFAVGVLALLGPRIPAPLKIFLLALAIIDDLGAIIIIAFFYTSELSCTALGLAGVGIAALALLNRRGVTRISPYVLIGLLIWVCVLESGVHATLAGVATALAVPLAPAPGHSESTLERLELALGPWVRVRRAAAVRLRQRRRVAGRHHAGARGERHPPGHRARPVARQAGRHLRLLARRHRRRSWPPSRKARRGRSSSASPSSAASASP